jgi:hypothetical protein
VRQSEKVNNRKSHMAWKKRDEAKKYVVVALMTLSRSLFLLNCVVSYQPSSAA